MKRILGLAALCLAACAEEEPGVPPPRGQLYFPLGMAVATPTTDRPFLVVGNTNFDQRYNAGFVSVFDLNALAALAPTGPDPRYVEDFGAALVDQKRVLQLGGPLLYVSSAQSGLSSDRIYVAARALNRVQALTLSADGQLQCGLDGGTRLAPTDCKEGAALRVGFEDPFALTYLPTVGARGSIAVSALPDTLGSGITNLGLIDVAGFEARIESETTTPLTQLGDSDFPVRVNQLNVAGFSSLIPVPGGLLGVEPALLATASQPYGGLPLVGLRTSYVDSTEGFLPGNYLGLLSSYRLDLVASAEQLRGVAVSGDRAYLSMRFAEAGTSYNAGIGVVSLEAPAMRLLSTVEVGDELGQPVLLERGAARWLYVPDLRDDKIWVLDVAADEPVVVASIFGRVPRDLNGTQVASRLLAGPADLVFADVGGRTLLFVTNFANSTLAVIDASDLDPRHHRVIARLGLDRDAEGKTEGQQ